LPSPVVASHGPAVRTHCSDDRCRGDQGHEVSILIVIGVAVGRYRGVEPRSNVSMIIMRPPQHGHGWGGWSVAAALSIAKAGRQFIILLMPSSATCAPTVTSAGAGPRIARRKPASASAGIYHPRTPHGDAAGDGVSKEKPRRGAGQLTETSPRRLEERRASKLSQTGGRRDTCQKCRYHTRA
jgi:hypothetical protein